MKIHGKEITTIVSDLDGTLLGEEKTKLNPLVYDLILEFKKKGVSFVAASGRTYKNMKSLFAPVLDDISLICENGSLIVKQEQTVYEKNIPEELSYQLLDDMLCQPGAETIVSSKRNLYTLADRKEFIALMDGILSPPPIGVADYHDIHTEKNKISIWWQTGIPTDKEKWFHEKYDDVLQVMDGGNGWLDFTMQGVNKGTALRALASIENIDLTKTLCFGDSENDVAMFRECAVSYAMKSGRDHVKAAADYICINVIEKLQEFLNA